MGSKRHKKDKEETAGTNDPRDESEELDRGDGVTDDPHFERSEEQQDGEPKTSKRKRKRKRKAKPSDDKEENEGEIIGSTNLPPSDLLRETAVDRTVYVEGIPFTCTPDQVKEFFTEQGCLQDVLEMRLPTWQDSGRLRGYGHVVFESIESHTKALALSGKYLQGRYLTIQSAKKPKTPSNFSTADNDPFAPPPKDCKTIFCHNLPYHATEEEIAKVFEQFGTIIPNGVRIARNSVSRQSKGFCYIDFESPSEAKRAVTTCARKHIHVGGRLIRVDYDTGRIKGSYRAETGRLWSKHVQGKK